MADVRTAPNAGFASISDFFRNATHSQKKEVFLSVLQQANNAQRKVMEQSSKGGQKR
ncbi:hypothetical protein GCM10009098_21760 [Rheinheimera aquimaris]|jgi:hypothetical protein|uniref:Uncharacterized protein n=1 Tax=Rheinheimera aquimaris TaxID=412437 RepID=A0ABP3NZB6_9GAMM|nr:hypothetical protein [Rheinheimera aquimaris]MCB5213920.1 hypothetical protein [Rheinheimera aquimaris]